MHIFKSIWRKIRPCRISPYRFNEIILKKQGLEQIQQSVEVLVMGSSHAAQAFNPVYYRSGKAFNFASMNLDLYTLEKLAQLYLPQLSKLKKLFLSFSVFSTGHEIDKGNNKELCFLLNYFYHIPYPCLKGTNGGLKRALKHRLKKFNQPLLSDFNGYFPVPKSAPKKMSKAEQIKIVQNRVAHHLRENNRPTCQIYLLEKIAQLCQKRKIELHVFIAPCRSDYNACICQPDKEVFKSLIQAQKKCGFTLHNFRCDKRFRTSDFLDADHLNESGAKKFTQIMNQF